MSLLIVRNNSNPNAMENSLMLMAYLQSQGLTCQIINSGALSNDINRAEIRAQLETPFELVVVLGGDGTILHTMHLLRHHQAPILGINYGHLGFLANSSEPGVINLVSSALAGELHVERRSALEIRVVCEGEPDPYEDLSVSDEDKSAQLEALTPAELSDIEEKLTAEGIDPHEYGQDCLGLMGRRSFCAFNEAAVTRGPNGRVIDMTLNIAGCNIAELSGDGLVIASATGSTAYSLSAGGPIVAPSYRGPIVTPLAPHSLMSRSVVAGENDVVAMTLEDSAEYRQPTLFIDGENVLLPEKLKKLYALRSGFDVELLKAQGATFYKHAAEVFF